MRPSAWPRRLAILAAVTAVYVAAGKLALRVAVLDPSASAVWPPTGIALAALLALGAGAWPAIFLGAFLVNLTTAGNLATSLGIAAGNTLEAVAGSLLVGRHAAGRRSFLRLQDYLKFAMLAGVVATAISPSVGVTSLCLGGFTRWADYGPVWLTWWLGDLGGALIVTPPLVLWLAGPRPGWSPRRLAEGGLVLAALLLVADLEFLGDLLPGFGRYPLSFLCLPPLLWMACRLGPRETATAGLALLATATWGTLRGSGPFGGFGPNASLLLLQAFMIVTVLTAMSLAAVVAEQRRAREDLERQASELAHSNAELEQFAHVASHDLQEPLRTVTNFAQLLAARARGRLDSEADDFVRYIVEGTARMARLIEDLLDFSRAGRAGRPPGPVALGDALRTALADLDLSVRAAGANVRHGDLPVVQGDETQLTQVFQNLIGNALKFRRDEPPAIEISAARSGPDWVVSVRDNGIGIAPQYAGKIFVIFQRLHHRDDYPGTGIGLAICKRIVARHGGRIWVESEPGRGSTFHFTLPADGPASTVTGG